jgi:hypothetical protein
MPGSFLEVGPVRDDTCSTSSDDVLSTLKVSNALGDSAEELLNPWYFVGKAVLCGVP